MKNVSYFHLKKPKALFGPPNNFLVLPPPRRWFFNVLLKVPHEKWNLRRGHQQPGDSSCWWDPGLWAEGLCTGKLVDSPTCDNKTRLYLLNSCVVSGALSSALQTLSFLILTAALLGIFHCSSIFIFTDENVCNSPKVTRLPSGRVKNQNQACGIPKPRLWTPELWQSHSQVPCYTFI